MNALAITACCAAGAAGFFGHREFAQRKLAKERLSRIKGVSGLNALEVGADLTSTGIARSIITRLQLINAQSVMSASPRDQGIFGIEIKLPQDKAMQSRIQKALAKAGLAQSVSLAACKTLMARSALIGLMVGAVIGALLSIPALVLFGLIGLAIGALSLPWALKRESQARSHELELELPDMLDIVALGLRSGLTFDLGFRLYSDYFDTAFSRACKSTYQQWAFGMSTRQDALTALADSYDSALFQSTIQGILQSIQLGSSLESDLTQAAQEARTAYRIKQEESVAKAPVKMMIPIGTMILPAMLLLVLGPVLLELMSAM